MRRAVIIGLGGVFLAGAALGQEVEGDRVAGKKVAGMCRTCHGIEGLAKIPVAPNIGGEPAAYLMRQLHAFKDGTRENEMMSVVAPSLSDQQIADVAAWYAGNIATAELEADPADAPESCVACHGEDGIAVNPDAPNLAGETTTYLETQLKAFRSGKRTHEIMSQIAADMTDDEIRAAAEWYSAVKLKVEMAE